MENVRFLAVVTSFAVVAGLGAASRADAQAVQVLDSVDAFGTSAVLGMGFRDPLPRLDFEPLGVGANTIIACQRAISQGLYCLDGAILRYWPDTSGGQAVIPDVDVLDCRDKALGFDAKKPNPCTSVTVDFNGAIWLAGRKANSHSLVKVVEKSKLGSACGPSGPWYELTALNQDAPHPLGFPPESVPVLCAREYAPGRPVLVDINAVDGDVAANFPLGPGILGLEERKTVVFFRDPPSGAPLPPVTLASGKTAWGLIGNEQLLSATLLQFGEPGSKKNFVLATTTLGRVLAKRADGPGAAFRVFDIPANRNNGGNNSDPSAYVDYSRCNGDTPQYYGIRVNSESGRAYVSDRDCGQVLALTWRTSGDAGYPAACDAGAVGSFCLVNARETVPVTLAERDVTLATVSSSTTVSPDGVSVSPGIAIDLRNCEVGEVCPLAPDGEDANSHNAAELTGVVREGPNYLMPLFQVRGVPDCRWWPAGDLPEACVPGAILNPEDPPEEQYLVLTQLLPSAILSQFEPGSLPLMLVSPWFRGQDQPGPGYKPSIDLFFGFPAGVQFRSTFTGNFDIADLRGTEHGCAPGTPVVIGGDGEPTPPDLAWDSVTFVSESYGSVGGPTGVVEGAGREHVDMLVNTGCVNPTRIKGGTWSGYLYSTEPVPRGDGVYAELMRKLFDDLKDAQDKTVCGNADDGVAADYPAPGALPPPLYGSVCSTLTSWWQSASIKLDACIAGSAYPRQSEAVNNCTSFLSQLKQYEATLAGATRFGADPANRIGLQQVRGEVVRYVFENHFLPSIPPDGFCSISTVGCPP